MLYRARNQYGRQVTVSDHDKEFELLMRNWERNRMYPPKYRKENAMPEVENFVEDLRKLADRDFPTLIVLPPNNVGLPEGAFVPKALLNYIADALEASILDGI